MTSIQRLRRFGGVSLIVLSAVAAGAVLERVAPLADAQEVRPPFAAAVPNGAPMSFADLIERVSPAVVSINAVVEYRTAVFPGAPGMEGVPPQFREWLEREFGQDGTPGQPREGRSLGSGFFISAQGHIVTNNHVIENATQITIDLPGGGSLPARIIGRDPLTDIALLQVETDSDRSFPFVRLDREPAIRVGDWVVAVGNPFGLGGTATAGIVSATGREIRSGATNYTDFLQIDAPINRGNSGGPTFDLHGNVVGVNSQIFSPTGGNVGIGFAIPSDVAARIVDQLLEHGRVTRGWLGVQIQNVTADIAESVGRESEGGAIVSSIIAGGPAERAGFRRGDVVLALNDSDITDATMLTRLIGAARAGEELRFRVLRDGRERTIRATLGERPDEQTLDTLPQPGVEVAPESASYFGMRLQSVTEAQRARLDLPAGITGVVVTQVEPSSEAARKGLRQGEVIVEAGGSAVTSVEAFAEAAQAARRDGRSAILVLVQSGGSQRYVALQLDAL